jgi:dihydropyrimidinase
LPEYHMDIRVHGGVVVNSDGMKRADVLIKDGLIAGLELPDAEQRRRASRVIDAAGKFVLPGIIDAHLHPVYADKIDTLSKSAAYGGITTLLPFVGAVKAWGKGGDLLDAVNDFIQEGESRSVLDFGMHCSLVHDDMETAADVIPKIIELGVNSFKGFMAYAKRGMMLTDDELLNVMEIISGCSGLFAVHAENGTALDYLEDKFAAEGKLGPQYYLPTHPNIAEAEAVFRVLTLAKITQCPLYLPHLSASEALDVLRLFKQWEGIPSLYTETCIHYLTLTDEMMTQMGSLAKVGPPLRQQRDIESMWKAVDEGLIDVIASDTAGHLSENKEPIWENIYKAASGLPGIESLFTVAYDEGINRGRVTLPQLVKLMAENPAKIFGLYPRKGILQEGSDADLVLFDPTIPHIIRAEEQHAKVDYSMYEGRACLGAPVLVMQRGNVLMEDGELKAKPGQGQYLPAAKTTSN